MRYVAETNGWKHLDNKEIFQKREHQREGHLDKPDSNALAIFTTADIFARTYNPSSDRRNEIDGAFTIPDLVSPTINPQVNGRVCFIGRLVQKIYCGRIFFSFSLFPAPPIF
jgi:hypothetical protein